MSTAAGFTDADLLTTLLDGLRERVRLLVAQRSADDPDVHDPWRGLRHTADSVNRLLDWSAAQPWQTAEMPPVADQAEPPAAPRLDLLALRFGLSALDVEFLLVALAPDLQQEA